MKNKSMEQLVLNRENVEKIISNLVVNKHVWGVDIEFYPKVQLAIDQILQLVKPKPDYSEQELIDYYEEKILELKNRLEVTNE